MSKDDPAKLTKVKVGLPFGLGSAEWGADSTELQAAWSLYVELATRISTQPLDLDQGLLREAFNSLHCLFGTTRTILKEAGPSVGKSRDSVGAIAIAVLNKGIRPFLAKWHPLLIVWENQKEPSTSPKDHERAWPEEAKARGELEKLREELEKYAHALAEIAGVKR